MKGSHLVQLLVVIMVIVTLLYPFGLVYYKSKLLRPGMTEKEMVALIGRETTNDYPSDASYKVDRVYVIHGPLHFILVAGKVVLGMQARCSSALVVRCNKGVAESWNIEFISEY